MSNKKLPRVFIWGVEWRQAQNFETMLWLFCKMIAMGKRLVYSQNSHGRCRQPQNTNSPKNEDERYGRGEVPQVFLAFFSGHLSRLPRKALSTPFIFSVNDDGSPLQTGIFLTFNFHHSSTSRAMAD